jgi:hypothetical protein
VQQAGPAEQDQSYYNGNFGQEKADLISVIHDFYADFLLYLRLFADIRGYFQNRMLPPRYWAKIMNF